MNIKRIILYIWRPDFAHYVGKFNEELICYHIADEYTFSEIDLPISDHERKLIKEWANRVQNTNNKQFVEAKTSRNYSRPDHKTRIDRWKENLTKEEVKRIVPIAEETAKQFGYELNNT